MQYNLLLVANDLYFKLLHICIKSVCAVCDMEKINRIFIADLGLRIEHRETINNLCNKIEFINTNINTGNSKKIYSKSWIDSVSQKTSILNMLVKAGYTPVIMLDSDTLIIEDFSDTINCNYDIQLCKRSKSYIRPDGLLLEYIASYVAINNGKGEAFVSAWINRLIERINQRMIPPYETPAMVETLNQSKDLKIGVLEDIIISCENNYFPGITKIIHAKGRNKGDHISIFRFANIKNLPLKKIIYLIDDREKSIFYFVFILKKIFSFYRFKEMIKNIVKGIIKKTS